MAATAGQLFAAADPGIRSKSLCKERVLVDVWHKIGVHNMKSTEHQTLTYFIVLSSSSLGWIHWAVFTLFRMEHVAIVQQM